MVKRLKTNTSLLAWIAPTKKRGHLHIKVTQGNKILEIVIADNGVGRKTSSKVSNGSTGMGLSLMENFYPLYQKFYNQKISSYIRNQKSDSGEPAGTEVYINIELDHAQT